MTAFAADIWELLCALAVDIAALALLVLFIWALIWAVQFIRALVG